MGADGALNGDELDRELDQAAPTPRAGAGEHDDGGGEPSADRNGRGGISDAVDLALARALERAAAEGRWSVVTQLATELQARRVRLASE